MTVKLHAPRPDAIAADLLQAWRNVPVAIAVDVSKGACGIDPDIRPLRPPGQQPRLFGRAVTALCQPPDFGAVLYALDTIQPGDVLVIAAQGFRANAMIGEILGGHLRRLKASGLICDGAIRDVAELAGWDDLSCYARSITPAGPTGVEFGEVNAVVEFGGRRIAPGDLVLGDDDGLAVLTPAQAASLLPAAQAKMALEVNWLESLASGKTAAQTFNLPAPANS